MSETIVRRDAWGVPQLWAPDVIALSRLQGQVCALDRAWQLEVQRWRSEGRVAEQLGDRVGRVGRLRAAGQDHRHRPALLRAARRRDGRAGWRPTPTASTTASPSALARRVAPSSAQPGARPLGAVDPDRRPAHPARALRDAGRQALARPGAPGGARRLGAAVRATPPVGRRLGRGRPPAAATRGRCRGPLRDRAPVRGRRPAPVARAARRLPAGPARLPRVRRRRVRLRGRARDAALRARRRRSPGASPTPWPTATTSSWRSCAAPTTGSSRARRTAGRRPRRTARWSLVLDGGPRRGRGRRDRRGPVVVGDVESGGPCRCGWCRVSRATPGCAASLALLRSRSAQDVRRRLARLGRAGQRRAHRGPRRHGAGVHRGPGARP